MKNLSKSPEHEILYSAEGFYLHLQITASLLVSAV